MDHEGVLGTKALATFKALKLKLATSLLVNLNNFLIIVHNHEVYLQFFLALKTLATLEAVMNHPLATPEVHLDSWLLINQRNNFQSPVRQDVHYRSAVVSWTG